MALYGQVPRQLGIFDRVFGLFTGGSALLSGMSEILSLIGVPLFRNLGGGDAGAQTRQIAIADLHNMKANSYRQWARLRNQLAKIKLLVLGEQDG